MMKKSVLIIFLLASLLLCSCGGGEAEVSDTSGESDASGVVSTADVISRDESDAFEISLDPANKNQEYFFESQAYTQYFDVVLRTYDDETRTHYTDRYGLALPDREIIAPCEFETYCQPLVINEKAVEKRFVTKKDGKAVIITDEGDILTKDEISTIVFPESVETDDEEFDPSAVLGVAVLTDGGGAVLINSDGKIKTEPFESILLTEKKFYSCDSGAQKYALDFYGVERGITSAGYDFVKLLDGGYTVIHGTGGYGVSDAEGKIALSGFETDEFIYLQKTGLLVYNSVVGTAETADIYSADTHQLITSAYSRVKSIGADSEYAIAYFDYEEIKNIGSGSEIIPSVTTRTLCRLIGKNAAVAFRESWTDCEAVDGETLRVKNDDGSTSEIKIADLTKLTVSDGHAAALASLDCDGNVKIAFADVNGDGEDELIVRSGISENGLASIFSADGKEFMRLYGSISLKKGMVITESNEKGRTHHIYDLATGGCTLLCMIENDGETLYGLMDGGKDVYRVSAKPDGSFADQDGNPVALQIIDERLYNSALTRAESGANALDADFFRY